MSRVFPGPVQMGSSWFLNLWKIIKLLIQRIASIFIKLCDLSAESPRDEKINKLPKIYKLPAIAIWEVNDGSTQAFDSLKRQTLDGYQIIVVTIDAEQDLLKFNTPVNVVNPQKSELKKVFTTLNIDVIIIIRNDINIFPSTLEKLYMAKFYRPELPALSLMGLNEKEAPEDISNFEELVFSSEKVHPFSPLAVSPKFIDSLPDDDILWEDIELVAEKLNIKSIPEISYLTDKLIDLTPHKSCMIGPLSFQKKMTIPSLDFSAIAPNFPDGETVLAVIPWLPIGGAEKHLYYLLKEFRSMGYRIVIVCTEVMDYRMGDQTFIFLREITPYIYHLNYLLPVQYWRDFLESMIQKLDIGKIFMQGSRFMYKILPDLKSRFPELFVVDQLFNADFELGHIAANCKLHQYIDLTFGVTEKVKTELKKRIDTDKVYIIHTGIDADEKFISKYNSEEARKRLSLPSDRTIVSFVGRFSPEKNPFVFLEIARAFGNNTGDPYFLMVGFGPLLEELEEELLRRPINNLKFCNFHKEVKDVHVAYAATDIMINCSLTEALSLVLTESMAHGVALVVRDVGDQSLLVQKGKNGFLCNFPDPEEYIEYIKKILSTDDFVDNAKSVSRLIVKDFSYEKMIEKYRRVLAGYWDKSEKSILN